MLAGEVPAGKICTAATIKKSFVLTALAFEISKITVLINRYRSTSSLLSAFKALLLISRIMVIFPHGPYIHYFIHNSNLITKHPAEHNPAGFFSD